jgi:hypothetical protein
MKLIQVINGKACLSIWVWKFLLTHEGGWRWSVSFYPDYENGLRYWWRNRKG